MGDNTKKEGSIQHHQQQHDESGLEGILTSLFERIKDIVKSETIVGNPLHVGDSYIIPLSKIKIGFMAGSRSGRQMGASGGAVSVEPIGLLVVSPDGKAYFYSTGKPPSSIVEKAIDLIPSVAEKILPEIKERVMQTGERKSEKEKTSD